MSHELIIGIAIVSTLIIGFAIHAWFGKVLSFKMHESAVIQYLKEAADNTASLAEIATAVELAEKKVEAVCQQSSALTETENGWKLTQQ